MPIKQPGRLLHPFVIQNKGTKSLQITIRPDYRINQIIRSIRSERERERERDGRRVNDPELVLISGRKSFASQLNLLGSHRQTEGKKERKTN